MAWGFVTRTMAWGYVGRIDMYAWGFVKRRCAWGSVGRSDVYAWGCFVRDCVEGFRAAFARARARRRYEIREESCHHEVRATMRFCFFESSQLRAPVRPTRENRFNRDGERVFWRRMCIVYFFVFCVFSRGCRLCWRADFYPWFPWGSEPLHNSPGSVSGSIHKIVGGLCIF